jgi:hypothetical protein
MLFNGEARQHPAFERLGNAFFNGGDELLRNGAAVNLVQELEVFLLIRLHAKLHLGILSAATGLLLMRVLVLGVVANGLTVGDLRFAHIRFDVEFALHALDDDLEMQFAHAGQNRLTSLGIGIHLQRRIFVDQLVDCDAQFLLVRLRPRLDRELNDGRGEIDGLERDRVTVGANRVARAGCLQTDGGTDVARENLLDFFTLVGVHLHQTADAFLLVLGRVQDRVAGAEPSRVNAEEAKLATNGSVMILKIKR